MLLNTFHRSINQCANFPVPYPVDDHVLSVVMFLRLQMILQEPCFASLSNPKVSSPNLKASVNE